MSSFSYGYNSDDLRTSCTEASGDVVTYGYDGLLHLSSESRTGTYAYTNAYTVDGEGNRTAQTVGGVSSAFTYDADDELTQVTGGLTRWYQYDANGEQTGRATTTSRGSGSPVYIARSYDYDGQLTGVGTTGYAYDPLGRRVSRTAGSTTTDSEYDGGAPLVERQGGSVTASYTIGNALLYKGGETPLYDGLGSSRTVTNSSASATATATTDAFGLAVTSSGTTASSYKFGATSGYRDDGDTGLIKVGCRYYDPETGRFTTRDTDLSQKAYVYCDGDPVNGTDPSGGSRHGGVGGAIRGEYRSRNGVCWRSNIPHLARPLINRPVFAGEWHQRTIISSPSH